MSSYLGSAKDARLWQEEGRREREASGVGDEEKASWQSHTSLTREKPSAGGPTSVGCPVPSTSSRCGTRVQSPHGKGADEVEGSVLHTEESTCVLSVSGYSACPLYAAKSNGKGMRPDEIGGGGPKSAPTQL